MNNFAALNMLNIGFIQFVLEEEREYNDPVEQQRRGRRPRTSWVRNWLKPERRIAVGHYHQLMEELRLDDQVSFYNFLRTGHNGLGIYINQDRMWWLLCSAHTKNTMRTEWTVRKRVVELGTSWNRIGRSANEVQLGLNGFQRTADGLGLFGNVVATRWTRDLTRSELDTNGLQTE